MPTYKDINLLTQKASIDWTEKLPVSDTEYITPNQIVTDVDYKISEDSYLTTLIWSKFVLHYTHNGDGTYGQSQTRNAVVTPLKFGRAVTVNVASGFKFALQYFDGPETGQSHMTFASTWIYDSYVVPANTYWCIIVANANDATTTDATTKALRFSGNGDSFLEEFDNVKSQIGDIETLLAAI